MKKFIDVLWKYSMISILLISAIIPNSPISSSQIEHSNMGGTVEEPYPPLTTPYQQSLNYSNYLPLIAKGNQVSVPPNTISWYVETVNTEHHLFLGCQQGYHDRDIPGTQNSIVILDFDFPRYWGGVYGANIFGRGPASTAAIAAAVEMFASGYNSCVTPDTSSTLIIGVATNNCGPENCGTNSLQDSQYYDHGVAWAQMVNQINTNISHLYPRIQVFGANDMEVNWNDPYTTRTWVSGYDSVKNWPLINFGDASGCPQVRTTVNSPCDNEWYQYSVWYISSITNSVFPVPLIYNIYGANANQWYSISAYGVDWQDGRLYVKGSMTQELACQSQPCDPEVKNSPRTGYIQLYNALNSDTDTSQSIDWSTDIGYSGW